MKKTQQIENKIRELCPELMELRFGCEIKDNGRDCLHGCDIPSGVVIGDYVPKKQTWTYLKLDNGKEVCMEDMHCCGEIIGHTPTLRHLLRAIAKREDIEVRIDSFNGECWINRMRMRRDECAQFDLTKSVHQNLEEDDELNSFIYNLLVKE